jgi:chromosome condensin MukBEF MukE localization factor
MFGIHFCLVVVIWLYPSPQYLLDEMKKTSKKIYLRIYNMSDNYEFGKAIQPQATDSSYVDKQQYNGYKNDINNGVYTNSSFNISQNLI